MQPQKFLELSKKLVRKNGEEYVRTSISRSYYAVFNYLSEFFSKNNITSHKNSAHKKMSSCFCNTKDQDLKDIGKLLDLMSTDRQDADYIHRKSKANFSNKKIAETNVDRADRIFDKFNQLTNSEIGKKEIASKLKSEYDVFMGRG